MENTQESTENPDFGSKQKRTKKDFSQSFLDNLKVFPYFRPTDVHVAGDLSTSRGRTYAGTFLDDGRAALPWSPDHEDILFNLLTSSSLIKIKEDRTNRDGSPVQVKDAESGKLVDVKDTQFVMVSDGVPWLVFLQGRWAGEEGDEWYFMMHDGRQRRRALMEANRRLAWCASLFNALPEDQRGKPGRRNLLIKLGKSAAKHDGWTDVLKDVGLPETTPAYKSDDTLNDGEQSPDSLAWLTETFARVAIGDEALGDATKKGCFYALKEEDVERLTFAGTACKVGELAHFEMWAKVMVAGVNVDPQDPASLLDSVAAKEAQVPTPPSLFAEQVKRFTEAKLDPTNPNSKPLYSPNAIAQKLGKSVSTLEDYALIHGLVDEVKVLLDSGEMSINFAVGDRESAFVVWPKNQKRSLLPPDKQRLVLEHLQAALAVDTTGDKVRFKGEAAKKAAKKFRDLAAAGKLQPLGADAVDGDGSAETVKPPTQKPEGETPEAPEKKPRVKALPIDLGVLRAKADSATGADASVLSAVCAALSVVLGGGDVAALDAYPALKDALVSALAAAKPAKGAHVQAEQPEEMFVLDLISAAIEKANVDGVDVPTVDATFTSGGKAPTEEQVKACNERIAGWVEAFKADQEATSLDVFLLSQVVSAQNAFAQKA